MNTIVLEAEARVDMGKGASRRLRRLANKVPAIIYGGDKKPETVMFDHFKLSHALEDERIFASVLDLKIKNKIEHVILKDLQRHPHKPVILHLDFQRVSAKDVLIKNIPIHFMNEGKAPGLKAGGILQHTLTQLEVRCQVKDLPSHIDIDLGQLNLDQVIHLSQIKLPKNVELTVDVTDVNHDLPVVSIHLPKAPQEEAISEETAPEQTETSGEETELNAQESDAKE